MSLFASMKQMKRNVKMIQSHCFLAVLGLLSPPTEDVEAGATLLSNMLTKDAPWEGLDDVESTHSIAEVGGCVICHCWLRHMPLLVAIKASPFQARSTVKLLKPSTGYLPSGLHTTWMVGGGVSVKNGNTVPGFSSLL